MGIHRGPNIVKDNLVFGYDTGYGVADNENTTRFYPGESTTNLFTYPYLSNHTDTTSSTTSIVKEDFGGGLKGIRFTQASTSPILSFTVGLPSSPVSGGTYTWSNYVHSTSTGSKLKSQVSVYVNGVRHWLTNSNTWSTSTVECNHLFKATVANKWHRVDNQITMPTGTLTSFSAGGFYRSTSNFTIKVANLQFEQKGHATPFTATSRSSTQSLIDLKRTTDIDVSNTSFDSTGQPEFDGTDDFIELDLTLSDLVGTNPTGITFEFVAKADDLTNPIGICGDYVGPAGTGFGIKRSSSNNKLEFRVYATGGIPRSTTDIPTDSFFYGVCIWDGTGTGEHRIYFNGILETTDTSAGTTWNHGNGDLRIGDIYGAMGSPGEWQGEIPVFKLYDSQLTADEIKQNFNALKNRFNI